MAAKKLVLAHISKDVSKYPQFTLYWIGKSGSRFPNFWLLLAPYLHVTWHSACVMANFVYIKLL